MTRCPYCLNSYMNVNPAHLIKHDKRLSDVRVEFPGWDLGKTSKGALLGRRFSEDHKKKISEALKNRVFSDRWRKKISDSKKGVPSHRKGIKATLEQRIANSARQQGISIEEWTGFSYNRQSNNIAKSPDWKKLRLEIKYRDNFSCGMCEIRFQGKELEVHHVIPRRERPDLMLEPSNCITLCKPCHRSINWHEADYVEQFKAKIKIIDSNSIKR